MKIQTKKLFLYFFIILIFLLTILLRYPHDDYEVGWDSYVYHKIAEETSLNGKIPYYTNFLSYFGFTPGSHQSSLIILLSGFNSISQLEMGYVIWICPLLYCFIGNLGIFILIRKLSNDLITPIFGSLLFSSSNIIIYLTYWTAATRGLFLVFLPFLFFLFLSMLMSKENKIYYRLLFFLFLIMLISIHRLYLPTFILIGIFYYFFRIRKSIKEISTNKLILLILMSFSILFLIPYVFKIPFLYDLVFITLERDLLLYNIIYLSYRINPLYILLMVFFILKVVKQYQTNTIVIPILFCTLLLTPFLIIAEYTLILITILIIILASYGWKIIKNHKKKVTVIIIIFIFLYGFVFNWIHLGLISKTFFNTEPSQRSMDQISISCDLFLKYSIEDDDIILLHGDKVGNLIQNPSLPSHPITDIQYGFSNKDSYQIASINHWPDYIFILKYNNPRSNFYLILKNYDKDLMERYSIEYLIEDKTTNDKFYWGEERNSILLEHIGNDYYRLYENNRYIVWNM